MQGGQNATRTQAQLYDSEKSRPSWWEKLLGAGVGAAGAFAGGFEQGGIVDKPTMALIGEAGPEMVVPLKHKIRPTYSQQYRYAA